MQTEKYINQNRHATRNAWHTKAIRWLALVCLPLATLGQPNINRVEWYLDTDPGYGAATAVSLSAAADVQNLNFSVEINPIQQGVHIVGVRSRDANGAWSFDNKWLFVKPYANNQPAPLPNLNRVEWYLDTDPGYGNATPVSISSSTDLSGLGFTIDINPIAEGVHVVGVRSRDANGAWSLDNKWLFVKPYANNQTAATPNINRVEWYMDTDPGYGNANALTITSSTNVSGLSFNIDVPSVSEGVHIVGVRSRDANSAWSADNKWLFVKPYSSNSVARPNINRVEWWLDTDPGYGNATAIAITADTNLASLSFGQSLVNLNSGVHIIGVRSRDANGAWSVDNKWLFIKGYGQQSVPQITLMEYYLDTDPGYGKGVPVALTPQSNLPAKDIIANIAGLNTGKHYIYFRSRDSKNAWSFDYVDSFYIASPVAAPAVNVNSIAKKFMCDKDSFNVGYDLTGTFAAGNQFNVYVSNASGDFTNERLLGTATAIADGSVRCYLPNDLTSGTGYKIRIKSSNPALTSEATPFTLNMYDRPFFNNDTTVIVVCGTDLFNLGNIWSTPGYSVNWNTLNPNAADTGTYRAIAINNNGCSDTIAVVVGQQIAHWTGAVSSDWHNAANWDNNKVPGITTHVIIQSGKPNNCIISTADGFAASVQVRTGAVLTTTNGHVVTIAAACNALPQ